MPTQQQVHDQPHTSFEDAMDELFKARDEARLKMHLLSMEARQKLHDLECKVEALAHKAGRVTESGAGASLSRVSKLAHALQDFIAQHAPDAPPLAIPVRSIMSKAVLTCRPADSLQRAAQIMWDADCGIVPVTEDGDTVVGVITDRDVCMAAYTRSTSLSMMEVRSAMSAPIVACKPDDTVEQAMSLMADTRIRRLPVVGPEGRLVGILALADVARLIAHSAQGDPTARAALSRTLGAISESRPTKAERQRGVAAE